MYCLSLVADSHRTSHRGKCNHIVHSTAEPPANLSQSVGGFSCPPVLPTFEDICQLPSYTLHHAHPGQCQTSICSCSFNSLIRNAVHENTEESVVKAFHAPYKCVPSFPKVQGARAIPIQKEYVLLWQRAVGQSVSNPQHNKHYDNEKKGPHICCSIAREGLLGKACQVLTLSGVAPNNSDDTCSLNTPCQLHQLSQALLRSLSQFISTSWLFCMQSFPRSTACGPSGLRVQHLLEAAEIPLPFPICSSLRDIVNLRKSLLLSPNI